MNTTAPAPTAAGRAPDTARRMAEAATAFLASLGPEQRRAATLPFGTDRRFVWDYRPPEVTPRNGLRLAHMRPPQQRLALALLDLGLSARGAEQVRQIMALEPILRESERAEGHVNAFLRDAENYSVCVFNEPTDAAWAWHLGGHHVGVHATVVGGTDVAVVPLFLGANPAEVRHGPRSGHRTLPEEEDWARALVRLLPPDQRQRAVVSPRAPDDILTDRWAVAHPFLPPRGLPLGSMDGAGREHLVRLLRHYASRMADDLAARTWARVEAAGLESVTFAWAGGLEPGEGHYYAIKGPTFLVEYDNTQNGANHVHSVWRDLAGDWGADLLAEHYAAAHARG